MRVTSYLQLIVALVGLLVYLLTRPEYDRIREVGRIMFFCGLFSFLLMYSGALLR